MAAFDLFSPSGIAAVERYVSLFNIQTVTRDPLSGIVDSSNVVFRTTYSPIMTSGSLGVYLNNSLQSAADYSVDHPSGTIIFNSAPSVQPQATYQMSAYPDSVLRGLLVAGFDEMELRWFQGLSLSSVQGTGQILLADQNSVNAFVVNTSGSDPPIGDIFWSTSNAQIAFFARCVQYAYVMTLMNEHAFSSFIWQEAQGLRVDMSRVAANLDTVAERLNKDLIRYQDQAMFQIHGGDMYGGSVVPPLTRETLAHRFWEKTSIDEDWRGTTPYVGHVY
jgi:hypothetical protein